MYLAHCINDLNIDVLKTMLLSIIFQGFSNCPVIMSAYVIIRAILAVYLFNYAVLAQPFGLLYFIVL